jgi:hypothetical protein
MKFKQIIAAAVLGLGLTAGAHAATEWFKLGNLDFATDYTINRDVKITTQGEQIADFITFTVSDELANSGNIVNLAFDLAGLSEMYVAVYKNYNGITLYDTNNLVFQETAVGKDFVTANFALESNSYVVVFQGWLANGTGTGHYDVNMSAVPEPETYAMMLAGMGMIGMITRRRKVTLG